MRLDEYRRYYGIRFLIIGFTENYFDAPYYVVPYLIPMRNIAHGIQYPIPNKNKYYNDYVAGVLYDYVHGSIGDFGITKDDFVHVFCSSYISDVDGLPKTNLNLLDAFPDKKNDKIKCLLFEDHTYINFVNPETNVFVFGVDDIGENK